MYFQYCLVSISVILAAALILYLIMKKKNQMQKNNIINLIICTVLAMICAVLTPQLANLFARLPYFSISLALVIAFLLIASVEVLIFAFVRRAVGKWTDKKEEGVPEAPAVNENEGTTEADTISDTGTAMEEKADEEQMAEKSVREEAVKEITVPETAGSSQDAYANPEPDMGESAQADFQDASEDYELALDLTDNEKAYSPSQKSSDTEQAGLSELLEKAMEAKINQNYSAAISLYEAALLRSYDPDLTSWIIVDLCSLYKMTGRRESAYKILESDKSNLLNTDAKGDILRNLETN